MAKFQLPLLEGEENYKHWQVQMSSYLTIVDLIHCIQHEPVNLVKAENQADNGLKIPTIQEDAKALATLRLCCGPGPLRVITTTTITAKSAWETLKDVYAPESYSTQQIYISEL